LWFFFFFWDICQGRLWTIILLISDSWVARITSVSHWRPVPPGKFLKEIKMSELTDWKRKLKWRIYHLQTVELIWILIQINCRGKKQKIYIKQGNRHDICSILSNFFFFWWNCGLNSGICACKTGTWATPSVHFVPVIFEMESHALFARAGLEPRSS
jgi:hypothetical protein